MPDLFSQYIVFVDESGDHGLKSIDSHYPVFVLAFCIFTKNEYAEKLVTDLKKFKFKHFGHDQIILHEADIRKDRGNFSTLKSKEKKDSFLNELSAIVENTSFTYIAAVIKKHDLLARYESPANPYHVALGFGLERVFYFLKSVGDIQAKTHIVVEKRGFQEDAGLELEFLRVCGGNNYLHKTLPFEIIFADKKSNSAGLQMADLLARPVGMKILRPDQPNRAFEIIEKKIYRNGRGGYEGFGLKCFPK